METPLVVGRVDPEPIRMSEPEPPWWSPGRLLRLCTGVREDVLAAVPSERARYTSLGGVVLGTALMAMLSMSVALYAVFGGFQRFIVVAVPVWGLFILSLDRWLISTTSTGHSGQALRKLVPRLLLSIALGVIVAEPLLLGIYRTAIEERVAKDRQAEIVTRGSELRLCNPVPGTDEAKAPLPAKCATLRLPIGGDLPEALALQRDGLAAQLAALKQTAADDAKAYAELEEKARQECNGTPGAGLTGLYGDGVNCARLRQEAQRYHEDHRIVENQGRIGEMEAQLAKVRSDLTGAQNKFKQTRDGAIANELNNVRQRHGKIGILERFRALGDLVSESRYVGLTQWALRILFIIIDALPVILKVLGGTTAYDRVLEDRVADQERVQQMRSDEELERYREHDEMVRHHTRASYQIQREQIDHELRVEFANLTEQRGRLMDAYENHLMRVAIGPAGESWDPHAQAEVPYIDMSEAPTHRFPPRDAASDGGP